MKDNREAGQRRASAGRARDVRSTDQAGLRALKQVKA